MTETKTWDYGDEGRAFPVEVGQVWQCGSHLFVCSDLMASDLFDGHLAIPGTRPSVVYCDPPWGQSLVNSFRTKAGLGRATYRWEDLYRRIAAIGHSRGLPVWVEGSAIGTRDGRKILGTIQGAKYTAYVDVVYYRKNPSGLYYCGPSQVPEWLVERLHGKDDEDTPGLVMTATAPAGLVIDPCAGRGQTSREAQRVGWVSINNELNPLRVSAALARMAGYLGGGLEAQPRRVA